MTTIIATFQTHLVKVLDVFDGPQGVRLAAVEALAGKPFVGGDKWPVRTAFATVRCDELVVITTDRMSFRAERK